MTFIVLKGLNLIIWEKRMLNKDEYEIKILNSDRIALKGYYIPQNSKKCVVAFAGFAGNCDKLFCNIMSKCADNNISFLFGNTRGSYEKKELKKVLENGDIQLIQAGACYENFDETIADMIDWISYVKNLGYKELFLVGASLACNKIIKLLNDQNNINIFKIFLLCPQDIRVQVDDNMLKEAKKLMDNNRNRDILSEKFFGCFDVSAETYYNIFTREDINNLPYLSENGDFKYFKNISIPLIGVLGSEDQGLYNNADAYTCMQKLKDENFNFDFEIIEGVKHTFKHFEDDVSNIIIKNIKE